MPPARPKIHKLNCSCRTSVEERFGLASQRLPHAVRAPPRHSVSPVATMTPASRGAIAAVVLAVVLFPCVVATSSSGGGDYGGAAATAGVAHASCGAACGNSTLADWLTTRVATPVTFAKEADGTLVLR